MYDDDALYLAAKVALPGRPYRNVNSLSEKPWEGEDIEFRLISTPDAPKPWVVPKDYKGPLAQHVVTCMFWLNSVTQKTNLKVTYGPFHDGGVVDNPPGAEVVYKQFARPYYYIMEARLPWSLLHAKGGKNPFKRGRSMTAFLTVLWGQSGQQRIEGLETVPTANFGWSWWSIQHWGQVEFSAQGHLPPRHETLPEYLAEKAARPIGTPFTIELPRALKASVSIVGNDGQILRELIGGEPRPQGKSTVYWDGYDWMGHRMPPGKYPWKAYASPGLKLKFLGAVGTSGQPPYNTTDGKGGWGADLCVPIDAACDHTGTYFLWDTSEGGRSIVKIAADGKTVWRNTPFVLSGGYGPHLGCATNGKFLYVVSGQPKTFLSRFQADNGLAAPFVGTAYPVINEPDDGKEHAEAGATDFKHGTPAPETIGLAATAAEVFAGAYSKGKVFVLDAEAGKKTRELACPFPRGICMDRQGDLYAISFDVKNGDGGRVLKFAKAAGPGSPLMPLDGLKAPWGIAVDGSGRIYVSEAGFSNQVWVYSAAGKLVARIGKAGGRPWGGSYQRDNLLFPTGLATDGNDSLVVAQASIPKVFSRYRIEPLRLEQQWFGDCDYSPSGWGDVRIHGPSIAAWVPVSSGRPSEATAATPTPTATGTSR